MLPSYLEKLTITELKRRVEELLQLQTECRICPQECLAKRSDGETGNCHSTNELIISNISPHYGEEPPLVGNLGSGTIFLTNCNLACEFCQNYDISHMQAGRTVTIDQLAEAMMNLQKRGCHNINFVTPTHFTPQIVHSLIMAIERGLEIPLVYNCGGYESIETLRLLNDVVDIYMPDIKYSNDEYALKYSNAKEYWETVREAIKEMHRQVGDLKISPRGIAQRGLLIRHLVLPNDLAGSKQVLEFIANEVSIDSYVNIMDQYHPAYKAYEYSELNRCISKEEYLEAVNYAISLGLHRGFDY